MDDLKSQIVSRDPSDLLSELLFEGVPHVFQGDTDLFRNWRRDLARFLGVDPSEVIVTVSAAAGASLNPNKNLSPFAADSDVDIAVVSDHHFSEAWHYLRGVDLAFTPMTPAQRAAVTDHQKRFIYWGCIAADRLLPLLPFATDWLPARNEMSARKPTEQREINFRIYKDFRALRGYQARGLRSLRATLLESGA